MRCNKAKAAPTYSTPFTCETEPWGARTMLSVQPRHPDIVAAAEENTFSEQSTATGPHSKLSVVSYNVLADSNNVRVRNCPHSVTTWGRRRETLLKEIFSVRADVLCLQDVDFFHQWWSPQLSSAGYDSLFKQRTSRAAVHQEGVVIAWKRDVFDLFRSEEMELNRLGEHEEDRSLAGKAATSDNVALMVLLQPWQDSDHPSGTCVVCTELHDEEGRSGDAVRLLQACGLTRTVEAFNSDFHLPIVLCGTMNCTPSSGTYEVLCRGVEAQDPARPGAPGKPLVKPLSTSTALIRWVAPQDDTESLNPPVDWYKVLWVPGGNRFLPGESVDAREADCLVYDLVETESGNVRSEQNPLRSFIVTGLSSGVVYEFRIAAVNELGQGPWSARSEPVRMVRMVGNDPEDRVLLSVASIKLIRDRELEDVRRRAEERLADPRTYELRKLIKVDGLLDLDAESRHPLDSVSGMTPRYSDAQLHPDSANVRTDTGYPVTQYLPTRRSSTGPNNGGGTARGRRRRRANSAQDYSHRIRPAGAGNDTRSTEGSNGDSRAAYSTEFTLGAEGDGTSKAASYPHIATGTNAVGVLDALENDESCRGELAASVTGKIGKVAFGREKSNLSRMTTLNVSGARSERQKHTLGLRSAYMSHSSGGEPAFTTLSDAMSGTVDYIFFSANCLLPLEVLSLPEMGSLVGQDVQETELSPTLGSWRPREWRGEDKDDGYTGEWSPYLRENPRKVTHRIPNEIFPSDHLMLMATLVFFEPRCPSTWR